jgi:hypothetical protein
MIRDDDDDDDDDDDNFLFVNERKIMMNDRLT